MKVKITVDIEKIDGTSAVEATTMDVDVPEFEEFTGPSFLLRVALIEF